MVWNKPRNVWQWLLLLTPAAAGIGAAQMAKWFISPIPPLHLANGAWVANVGEHIGRVSSIALEAITICSAALALILSRGPELGQRVLNAVFFMLCLLFLNSFVAFCGCASLGVPNYGPYFIKPASAGPSIE